MEGPAPCCRYRADGVLGVRVTSPAAIEIGYRKCALNAMEFGISRKAVGLGSYRKFGDMGGRYGIPSLFVKQKQLTE